MPKQPYNPKDENDKQLLDTHRIFHAWISSMREKKREKIGSYTIEDVWNMHKLTKDEMQRRGFAHNYIDPFLDAEHLPRTKLAETPDLKLAEIHAGLESFVLVPGFIAIVGGVAEGRETADIDLVIKSDSRNLEIEKKIAEQPAFRNIVPSLHIIYDKKGSSGLHTVAYDLVLVKRSQPVIQEPKYSFPLFGVAPSKAALPDTHSGQQAYLHRENDTSKLLTADAEEILEFPYLLNEAISMQQPKTFILGGFLSSDGKFGVHDIFRWNSTELVESPEIDRQFFLDKFQWTQNIYRLKPSYELEEFQEKIELLKPFLPLKVKACKAEKEHFEIAIQNDKEELRLLETGLKLDQIDDYHDVAEMLAYDEIQKLKTKKMLEVEGKFNKDIHFLLRTMYWEKGMFLHTIAQELLGKPSRATILYWMRRLRIPTRPVSPPNAGKHLSLEHREKIGFAHRGVPESEEAKKHLSEYLKAHPINFWKGKHRPITGRMLEGLKLGCSVPHKVSEKSKEVLRKYIREHGSWNKGKTKETDPRVMQISIKKKLYKFTDAHVRNWSKSMNLRPNKKESILLRILQDLKLPFKYSGDGDCIIGGKIPDFINVDGKKQLIEFFGKYWHEKDRIDNGQSRIKHFKQYGYDTLIIWEEELKNENLKNLCEKLLKFGT